MSALIALLLPLAALALELYLHHSGRLNGKPLLWSLPVWWLLPFVAGAAWWVYDTDAGMGFFAAYLFTRAWFLFYAFCLNDITARFHLPTALQKRLLNCALIALSLLPVLLAGILAGINALAAPLLPLLLALAAAYTAWRLLGKDTQPQHHHAYALLNRWFAVWPQPSGQHFWLSPKALRRAQRDYPDVALHAAKRPLLKKNAPAATSLAMCLAAAVWIGAVLMLQALPAVWALAGSAAPACCALWCALLGTRSLCATPTLRPILEAHRAPLQKSLIILLFFSSFALLLGLSGYWLAHGQQVDVRAGLAVVLLVLATGIGYSLYLLRRPHALPPQS